MASLARFIEFVRGAFGLVLELIAGAAHAGALRISALDHEVGDHAVKDGSVVEGIFCLLAGGGVGPLALALGEVRQSWRRSWGVFFEQAADDGAFAGFEYGIGSGCAGHSLLFAGVRCSVSGLAFDAFLFRGCTLDFDVRDLDGI